MLGFEHAHQQRGAEHHVDHRAGHDDGLVFHDVDAPAARRNASSLGTYNGTVPVGFVDPADNPTTRLRVITSGAWQLDIASAALAPPLGSGREGIGGVVEERQLTRQYRHAAAAYRST